MSPLKVVMILSVPLIELTILTLPLSPHPTELAEISISAKLEVPYSPGVVQRSYVIPKHEVKNLE